MITMAIWQYTNHLDINDGLVDVRDWEIGGFKWPTPMAM